MNVLREVCVLLYVVYFCGPQSKEKSMDQNQEHLMK